MSKCMKYPFVIFDRDGTLIESVHHLVDSKSVRIKPEIYSCLIRLKRENFKFGMITNQSVISRGMASLSQVEDINKIIMTSLEPLGITFDFVYICPHLPTQGCICRKPKTEFGIRAIRDHGVLPEASFMVGDQDSDMAFAKRVGFLAVQITSGQEVSDLADYSSSTLENVASWIIQNKNMGA